MIPLILSCSCSYLIENLLPLLCSLSYFYRNCIVMYCTVLYCTAPYRTVQTIFYIVSEDENQPKKLVQMEAIAPGTGDGSKGGVGEGELWIGGIGVAAGYLNASDLTKEVRMCYELNLFSLFTSASIFLFSILF